MGTVDPNQQIEVKKSARQIYAEAFMDDENPMFRTNTQFADFADEEQVREYNEKYEAEKKMTAEERARQAFEDSLADDEDEESIQLDGDSASSAKKKEKEAAAA